MTKKAAIIINFNAWTELSTNTTISFLKSIIEKTDYPDYEIILYENNSNTEFLKRVFNYINTINKVCIKLISPINKVWYNMDGFYDDATKITDAEIFVFSNDDMKIINNEWLSNAIKWLESDNNIGLLCPHTNITYGRVLPCKRCSLIEFEKHKRLFSCLFTEGCIKKHQPEHKLWYRDWGTMGIYICSRENLKKVGMHDRNFDYTGQDLAIILRFENYGFKNVVAMDSLVEHYGDHGHLTQGYISDDGTSEYNFRAIHAYKNINEYLNNHYVVSTLHPHLKIEWNKWNEDFYMNSNPSFSRDEYNKWITLHNSDWNNDIKYQHATITIICNLKDSVSTNDAILTIESVINSIKNINIENVELIIYESNSVQSEKFKLFEYLNKMKLKIELPIKWISISNEEFNINKVYNRISEFTKNEVLCFINQDIQNINKEWLQNAMHWILFSEYRTIPNIILLSSNILSNFNNTMIEHKLDKYTEDVNKISTFFIKRSNLIDHIKLTNENLYKAKDIIIEGRK